MSRVQLAPTVSDVAAAVVFYSKPFHSEPAKRRPGDANFAIAEPPLKEIYTVLADADTMGRGDGQPQPAANAGCAGNATTACCA